MKLTLKNALAVAHTRSLEFTRDRSALAWNLLFPIMALVAMAALGAGAGQKTLRVAVANQATQDAAADVFNLSALEIVEISEHADADNSLAQMVARHGVHMALRLQSPKPASMQHFDYWIHPTAPQGAVLERLLWQAYGQDRCHKHLVPGQPIRHIDWLMPGVLALNMMLSALYGIGYVIIRYRQNGYLRRLQATPLSPIAFLLGQAFARFGIVMASNAVIFVFACTALGIPMRGSHLLFATLFALGTAAMMGWALVLSARTASEEWASGLINLSTWPMMLLAEIWFSLDGAPDWIRTAAQILPLTHTVAASRKIMLDGAGWLEMLPHLGFLLAFILATYFYAARRFRWSSVT